MPYWQLFYHLVWATKNREPLLVPEIEPIIYNYIRAKAIGLGATVFALNGWTDHSHLVASIPPKISVATFVGQVKGVTSAKFNQSGHPNAPFFWQDEYAAFSFDQKRLPNYVAYVERQKEHHKNHTTIPILERMEGDGVRMARELGGLYTVNDVPWRAELEELERLGF